MDEAIESMIGLFAAAKVESIRPDELQQAFATGGKPALTRLLVARWAPELSDGFRAMWFDELGQRDSAMAVLERAYDARWGGLLFLLRFHPMDGLRSDPRYVAFLRKVGIEP